MSSILSRRFDSPDETRSPDKTMIEVVDLGGVKAARMTLQPGWSWSGCIKPVVGTESCQVRHVGTAVSGRLVVTHDDGTKVEIVAGDAYRVDPGHDASVVGDEPFMGYEFESTSAGTYATPS